MHDNDVFLIYYFYKKKKKNNNLFNVYDIY